MSNNWQFVSLELAKKIRELGFNQKSMFWWVDFHGGLAKNHHDYDKALKWEIGDENRAIHFDNRISAFSVAEMGNMLPKLTCVIWKFSDNLFICRDDRLADKDISFEAETEADARAKMLIYLKEQGII